MLHFNVIAVHYNHIMEVETQKTVISIHVYIARGSTLLDM